MGAPDTRRPARSTGGARSLARSEPQHAGIRTARRGGNRETGEPVDLNDVVARPFERSMASRRATERAWKRHQAAAHRRPRPRGRQCRRGRPRRRREPGPIGPSCAAAFQDRRRPDVTSSTPAITSKGRRAATPLRIPPGLRPLRLESVEKPRPPRAETGLGAGLEGRPEISARAPQLSASPERSGTPTGADDEQVEIATAKPTRGLGLARRPSGSASRPAPASRE